MKGKNSFTNSIKVEREEKRSRKAERGMYRARGMKRERDRAGEEVETKGHCVKCS